MTCQECKELLPSYALDALDEVDEAHVSAHLKTGCRECREHLARIRAVCDVLPLSLDPVAPPTALRSRLMDRISAESSVQSRRMTLTPARTSPSGIVRLRDAFVAAAVAAAITGFILWRMADDQRKSIASLRDQLAQAQSDIRLLRSSTQQTSAAVQLLQSPAIQLVSLEGGAQPRAKGRVFWDPPRNAWHFYAANLNALPSGKTYELWFINSDQKKIPAGTFTPDETGSATLLASAKPDYGHVVALAVTDEPTGGAPQPTGQIQLVGQVK